MVDFSRHAETKLYRRTKFILFNVVMAVIALLLTGTVFLLIPFLWLTKLSMLLEAYSLPRSPILGYAGIWVFFFWLIRKSILGGVIGRFIVYVQNFKDAGKFGAGGNARFAGMIEEYLDRKKGKTALYFGRSLFNRFWHIGANDDRHMLTIAGSRSGKGVACIIPNLLTWKGSVLCIDPKGTNTHVTAERRRKMGQKVHVIDPFLVTTDETAYFNPLDILDPDSRTITEDISSLTDGLIPPEPDAKNKHFTESATALLGGYIAHVISSGHYKNPSLIDVFNIVHMSKAEQIDVLAHMMMNESCGGLAQQAAKRVMEGWEANSSEYQSVVSTIKTNLNWLASDGFKEVLSKSSFSFGEMKDTPTSVYLVIPPDMLAEHHIFLRLFVNIAMNRYTRGGKAKIPGLFVIDEAPALGYMKEISKAYAVLASYNMFLWTFFQDKGQLDNLYGSEARVFIGSSRAVQVFSIVDEDAEWVASMIGTRGMAESSEDNKPSSVMALRDSGSVTKNLSRSSGLQYILRTGKNPLILDLVSYHKSYTFAPLAFKDPDYGWPPLAYVVGQIFRPVRMVMRVLKYPLNFAMIALLLGVIGYTTLVLSGNITAIETRLPRYVAQTLAKPEVPAPAVERPQEAPLPADPEDSIPNVMINPDGLVGDPYMTRPVRRADQLQLLGNSDPLKDAIETSIIATESLNACAKVASPEHVEFADIDALTAIAECRNAVDADPENIELWAYLARSLHRTFMHNEEAREWAQKSAEAGNLLGQYTLAMLYTMTGDVARNYTEGARWNRLAADQGYAAAQNLMGQMYRFGDGVEQSDTEAVHWYWLAANQGNIAAQNHLGRMYLLGIGVEKNVHEATRWYQLAAEQGDEEAQELLETLGK